MKKLTVPPLLADPAKRKLILPGLLLLGVILLLLFAKGGSAANDSGGVPSAAKAEQALEQRIRTLLNGVDGVKDVRVLVTVDRFEALQAENADPLLGGFPSFSSDRTVYVPVIRGVGVTCKGGDSPVVRQRIVSLLSACLGIGENRISVAPG